MDRAARVAVTTLVTLMLGTTLAAAGPDIESMPRYAGHVVVDASSGVSSWETEPRTASTITDVYNNLDSPGIFAVASADLRAIWGDSLQISQTGVVEALTITIFNSTSSTGPLASAEFLCTLRDAATHIDLANYLFGATFSGGLLPGYYAMVTFANLSTAALPLELHTTELVFEQSVNSSTGAADRLGVVSLSPATIGSSPPSMYIDSATFSGGVPGFYHFIAGPADPGYRIQLKVVDVVTPTSWGRVKRLYR